MLSRQKSPLSAAFCAGGAGEVARAEAQLRRPESRNLRPIPQVFREWRRVGSSVARLAALSLGGGGGGRAAAGGREKSITFCPLSLYPTLSLAAAKPLSILLLLACLLDIIGVGWDPTELELLGNRWS